MDLLASNDQYMSPKLRGRHALLLLMQSLHLRGLCLENLSYSVFEKSCVVCASIQHYGNAADTGRGPQAATSGYSPT